jgi:hypothetical protein
MGILVRFLKLNFRWSSFERNKQIQRNSVSVLQPARFKSRGLCGSQPQWEADRSGLCESFKHQSLCSPDFLFLHPPEMTLALVG